jgi:hypothetical protein
MLPDAHICHHTQGRIRIKIPSRRGGKEYFSLVNAQFSELHGIERVEVNPVTASVLLITEADVKHISDHAEAKGLFLLRKPNPHSTALSRKIMGEFNQVDDTIRKFTGGDMDLPALAFLGLVGAGIYQVSIGNFTAPAWYTAFWYATNIFTKAYGGESQDGRP